MTAADIIFWYTGATAWAIIGVVALGCVALGCVKAWQHGKEWDSLWRLGTAERSDIQRAVLRVIRKFPKGTNTDNFVEQCIKLSSQIRINRAERHIEPEDYVNFEVGDKVKWRQSTRTKVVSKSYPQMTGNRYPTYTLRDEHGDCIVNVFPWQLEMLERGDEHDDDEEDEDGL